MYENALSSWAHSRGYQVAWGSMDAITVVRSGVEEQLKEGEIDKAFAEANLAFDFPPESHGTGRSILVVVMPRPAHAIAFEYGGQRLTAVMPPTYERYRPTFEDVRQDLAANVLPGCSVEHLNVPLKALAAALGLVRYGRNNLTYAGATGSYMQLLGYSTDASLALAPGWVPHEPRLLDQCRTCRACERACPTGAITRDRVLLHAERCLTCANETAGAWPSWVPPSAHHCLIGCLRCQSRCPANPPMPLVETGVTFAEEETHTLLAGSDHRGVVWDRIRARLVQLGRPYQEDVMGRNLQALIEASGAGSGEKTPA